MLAQFDQAPLKRALFLIAAATVAVDAAWLCLVHFDIALFNYLTLVAAVPFLMGASAYYNRLRNEQALSAVFAASAFFTVFPAACCLLSYFLLTIAGPRIDSLLAGIDAQMGFNWVALMRVASEHSAIMALLKTAYLSVLAQTLCLLLVLGWKQNIADIYGLCLALSFGAIITLTLWCLYPSFGAFSVFQLPPDVARGLGLALDTNYGADLVYMLEHGPGHLTPAELRGIIGFPSFHTLQSVLLIWYARNAGILRWPAIVLNGAVLLAVPVHGGHHLIDLFGGLAVSLIAILLADGLVARCTKQNGAEPAQNPANAIPA